MLLTAVIVLCRDFSEIFHTGYFKKCFLIFEYLSRFILFIQRRYRPQYMLLKDTHSAVMFDKAIKMAAFCYTLNFYKSHKTINTITF